MFLTVPPPLPLPPTWTGLLGCLLGLFITKALLGPLVCGEECAGSFSHSGTFQQVSKCSFPPVVLGSSGLFPVAPVMLLLTLSGHMGYPHISLCVAVGQAHSLSWALLALLTAMKRYILFP